MFVGEDSANKGEGVITIGTRREILRRAEVGQNFLDYCRDTILTERKGQRYRPFYELTDRKWQRYRPH
jgi:hypothetical protein